jgi:hypothetical protein
MLVLTAPGWLLAQGTLLMDQVCGPDRLVSEGLPALGQTLGQSFTPVLTGIDFVQLQAVAYPGSGSSLSRLHLYQGGPGGPLLGTTEALLVADSTLAIRTFYFTQQIPLTPSQVYYLGLEATRVDPSTVDMAVSYVFGWPYDRGTLFANGSASPNADLWFREGVVVPEPGACSLLTLGLACWPGLHLWRRRNTR